MEFDNLPSKSPIKNMALKKQFAMSLPMSIPHGFKAFWGVIISGNTV